MTPGTPGRANGASASRHTRLMGTVAVLAVVVYAVTGCSSQPAKSPAQSPIKNTSPSSQVEEQHEGNSALERDVLGALESLPYGRGAVYDADKAQVVVTIWTHGRELTESELAEITLAARNAAGETSIIIEVSEQSPPVAD